MTGLLLYLWLRHDTSTGTIFPLFIKKNSQKMTEEVVTTQAARRLHHRSNSLDRNRFFAIKKLFATFRFHGIRIVRQECTWDLSWMMQLLFASDAFSKKELPTRYNSQSSQKGKVYCSRDPQSWKGCLYHKSQCIMWNRKLTRSFSCNLNRSPSFNPKFLINVQSVSYCKWSS